MQSKVLNMLTISLGILVIVHVSSADIDKPTSKISNHQWPSTVGRWFTGPSDGGKTILHSAAIRPTRTIDTEAKQADNPAMLESGPNNGIAAESQAKIATTIEKTGRAVGNNPLEKRDVLLINDNEETPGPEGEHAGLLVVKRAVSLPADKKSGGSVILAKQSRGADDKGGKLGVPLPKPPKGADSDNIGKSSAPVTKQSKGGDDKGGKSGGSVPPAKQSKDDEKGGKPVVIVPLPKQPKGADGDKNGKPVLSVPLPKPPKGADDDTIGKSGGSASLPKPPKGADGDNIGKSGVSAPLPKPPKGADGDIIRKSGVSAPLPKPPKGADDDTIGKSGVSAPLPKPPKGADDDNIGKSGVNAPSPKPPKGVDDDNTDKLDGIIPSANPPNDDKSETPGRRFPKGRPPLNIPIQTGETPAKSESPATGVNVMPPANPSIFFSDYSALVPFTLPSTTTKVTNASR